MKYNKNTGVRANGSTEEIDMSPKLEHLQVDYPSVHIIQTVHALLRSINT